MDGATPTTADAPHGESRGYAAVDGGSAATRAVTVRGLARKPGRVYVMAPARWKSASSARRPALPPVAMPAPAQWVRSRRGAGRPLPGAPRPAAERWLLPPTWPFDQWHVTLVARLRRLASMRIAAWRGSAYAGWVWATRQRRQLVAGAALGVIAGAALVMLRFGPAHPGAAANPARMAVAVAAEAPAPPAPALSRVPVPAAIVPAAPDAPAASSTVRSAPAGSGRTLLSEVSTMDLMMPVEEPDLDITSRDSLWSQVGQSAGVDPLLLYAIALVESKALYPDGRVAPTPWLFRVNDHLVRGDRRDVQLAMAAASQFGSAVQDVGIMQVYYPMHRDAVRDPLTLLNPRTNITVAAKILRDGMRQTRDRVLGVGYYHSHTPSRARDYGSAVLTVYQRLQAIHRPARRGQAVAR